MEKKEQYEYFLSKADALLCNETDLVANTANACALLKEDFGFFWAGFYFASGEELVLGTFQGPVACTRILRGKGVCGKVAETLKTELVADVHEFPGHIACNEKSKSEIVVPLFLNGTFAGVLDIDADAKAAFDETDAEGLEKLNEIISRYSHA